MKDIDIYVKCYYSYAHSNRRVSATGCNMFWIYLLSDTHFNDLLQRKINAIEKTTQSSGRILNELYIEIFYRIEEEELCVNLNLCTDESGRDSSLVVFGIAFDDINRQADTIKLGHDLKPFLLKEYERVHTQSTRLFLLILFLQVAVVISLGVYGINSSNLGYIILSSFISASLMGTKASLFECCIHRCLPKETKYKTKLNLDSSKQEKYE